MQLTVDIPEDQVERLEQLGRERNATKDHIVREALAAYLPRPSREHLLDYYGVLKGKIEDGQAFQDRMRAEWERNP